MAHDFCEKVRKQMAILVGSRFPQFRAVATGTDQRVVAVWRQQAKLCSFFLLVACTSDRNAFTIDIAWDVHAEFPWTQRYRRALGDSGEILSTALTKAPFRCRLDRLWGARRDYWWGESPMTADDGIRRLEQLKAALEIRDRHGASADALVKSAIEQLGGKPTPQSQENLSKVTQLCDDAVARIARYALPFFDRVVLAQSGAK